MMFMKQTTRCPICGKARTSKGHPSRLHSQMAAKQLADKQAQPKPKSDYRDTPLAREYESRPGGFARVF